MRRRPATLESKAPGSSDRSGSAPTGGLMHLATDYPSASHSFIMNEVEGLRRLGLDVHTSSINPPIPEQVLNERDRRAVATTLYIKSVGAKGGLRALAVALRRRPLALFRCAFGLLSIDLLDLPHALKRTMQFGEALILWHRCTQLGITSVHAHLVVCISYCTKAQLQRIGGRSNWDKIKVVRCGIDLDHFALRPPRGVA